MIFMMKMFGLPIKKQIYNIIMFVERKEVTLSKASKWIVLNSDIHFDKKYEDAWHDLEKEIILKDIQESVESKNWQVFHDNLIRSFEAVTYVLFLRVMLEAQKEYGRIDKKKEEWFKRQITDLTKTTANFVSLFDRLTDKSELYLSLSNKALELQNKIAEVELLSEET